MTTAFTGNLETCEEARAALRDYYKSGREIWHLEWHLLVKEQECCEKDR